MCSTFRTASPGFEGFLLTEKLHVAANHHAGQLFFGSFADVDGADVLALAQDRAAVGNCHDLVELVGDEEDGFSFFCEVLHDLHQLVDFLRRQNRGRLVEDQNFVVTVEHFQNFGTLLHADGDIADQSVRIDLQTVLFAQVHDLFAGPPPSRGKGLWSALRPG